MIKFKISYEQNGKRFTCEKADASAESAAAFLYATVPGIKNVTIRGKVYRHLRSVAAHKAARTRKKAAAAKGVRKTKRSSASKAPTTNKKK